MYTTQEEKDNPLLLNTFAKLAAVPVDTKVFAAIGGHPAGYKFVPFYSDGIQTDDIGGDYIEVPEVKGYEVVGTVIEGAHPTGKKPGKLFKLFQYTDRDGNVRVKLMKNLRNARVVKYPTPTSIEQIKIGSKVKWLDPDIKNADTSRTFEVYDIKGDVVCIADDYGEAEVLPEELIVIE